MKRRVGALLAGIGLAGGLVAVGAMTSVRNEIGDAAARAGLFDLARAAYASTAAVGSARGQNNAAVLDYHLVWRRGDAVTREERVAAKDRMEHRLQAPMAQGYAAAFYNAALPYHRRRFDRPGYEYAKRQYKRAEALGDELAPVAYALHLTSRVDHADAPERRRLVKALADVGNPYAAYAYGDWLRGQQGTEDQIRSYYRLAAEGGVTSAMEWMGRDRGVSEEERIIWLVNAVEHQSIAAAWRLARIYDAGSDLAGAEPNRAKAMEYYRLTLELAEADWVVPRELVVRSDGLRWRSLRRSVRHADVFASEKAAARLAELEAEAATAS